MKVDSTELQTILDEEQFTTTEREIFTRVHELEQELRKIQEQLEKARMVATAVYRTKLSKLPEIMEEKKKEIEKLERELLEKSRALCKKGIHFIKFLGVTYANSTYLKAGNYYYVTYCPICGEIFHASRYPSYFNPTTIEKKGCVFTTSIMPHGSVEATKELRELCAGKKSDFIDESYKISHSRTVAEKLEAFIREMGAEQVTWENKSYNEVAAHIENIDLAQSIVELIDIINCRENEYIALQEQPRRFCELFGHDIAQTPHDYESTEICRCCGKRVNWSSVESTYKEARLADMINLAYVDHTFGGKLNQPTRVVYIKPKVDDSFWDD